MGSYPMRDGVHDYPADETNKYKDTRNFPASEVKAGVEFGLGSVEHLERGVIQPQQETHSNTFRQESGDEAPVSGKNGKSFRVRY